MNKYYLIISLAVIIFIGSYSIFSAGYEVEDFNSNDEETVIAPEEKERDEGAENNKEEQSVVVKENDEEIDKDDEDDEKSLENLIGTGEGLESNPNSLVDCNYKLQTIPSPKAVEHRPNSKEAWVSSLMNKDFGVFVIDLESRRVKSRIQLPDGGGVEITFNDDGSLGYVSQMETGRVFEINSKKKEIERVIETGGSWTKVVKVSNGKLFASNWSSNNISIIDLDTEETEIVPTTTTPRGIYVDGDYLYVAGFQSGEIVRHDLKEGSFETLITTGGAMRHLVGTNDYVYGSDMGLGKIFRVEKSSGEVEEFAETENNPNTIRFTDDEKVLAVSNRGINHQSGNYNIPGPEWGSVLFYDAESGKLLDVVVGGNQPTGLSIYENELMYSNFLDGDLVFCDLPESEHLLEGSTQKTETYKEKIIK